MLDPSKWITRGATGKPPVIGWIPPAGSGWRPLTEEESKALGGALTYPGTTRPFPYKIDMNSHPEEAAKLFFPIFERLVETYKRLRKEGKIKTVLSGQPEREQAAVEQQLIWICGGMLSGQPHTYGAFKENLEEQYENNTGEKMTEAPEEVKKQFEEGTKGLWDTFAFVGAQAKITTPEPVATPPPPPKESNHCEIEQRYEPRAEDSEFKMSKELFDARKRAALAKFFKDLPKLPPADEPDKKIRTFEKRMFPASAWAVSHALSLGGYCNAVAKTAFFAPRGGLIPDMVWETEPLEVRAGAAHTPSIYEMTVKPHDANCATLVVGAVGGTVETGTLGIDTLEGGQREFLQGLRKVTDAAVEYGAPGADKGYKAVMWGLEKLGLLSTDLNASALAHGFADIRVGGEYLVLEARSTARLKGEETSYHSEASPQQPGPNLGANNKPIALACGTKSTTHATTLRVRAYTVAELACAAKENGVVDGLVQGQLGIALVGLCVCGDEVMMRYLTDSGLFVADEGAASLAGDAANQLQRMVGEVLAVYADMPAGEVIPHAKANLPGKLERVIATWTANNGSKSDAGEGILRVQSGNFTVLR